MVDIAEVEQIRSTASHWVAVTIELAFDVTFEGFVLGVGRCWVLLYVVQDFHPDGYALVRCSDVVRVRKSNAFFQRALRRCIAEDEPELPRRMNLDTEQGPFQALRRAGELTILNFDYDEEDCLYLGVLESMAMRHVEVRTLSPAGRWGSVERVGLREVSTILFRCAYVNVFTRECMGRYPGSTAKRAGA
jgi:hypothetical protein